MTTGHGQVAVTIEVPGGELGADLVVPSGAEGMVLFAHGSGSSRHSPRNRHVAEVLHRSAIATLLVDLLTPQEERIDDRTGDFRFDIELLARRTIAALGWLHAHSETAHLPAGIFGASTGAAAALMAAAENPARVYAVVSRGGRPDLARPQLARVRAPVLLIVGSDDRQVLQLNREALQDLPFEKDLYIVDGATHLFEEPGALDEVARVAARWFTGHFSQDIP